MGHQLRVMSVGMGTPAVIGFDMTAAFALAKGLGISRAAVAQLLPIVEAAAIPAMNSRMRSEDG